MSVIAPRFFLLNDLRLTQERLAEFKKWGLTLIDGHQVVDLSVLKEHRSFSLLRSPTIFKAAPGTKHFTNALLDLPRDLEFWLNLESLDRVEVREQLMRLPPTMHERVLVRSSIFEQLLAGPAVNVWPQRLKFYTNQSGLVAKSSPVFKRVGGKSPWLSAIVNLSRISESAAIAALERAGFHFEMIELICFQDELSNLELSEISLLNRVSFEARGEQILLLSKTQDLEGLTKSQILHWASQNQMVGIRDSVLLFGSTFLTFGGFDSDHEDLDGAIRALSLDYKARGLKILNQPDAHETISLSPV